jgi:hypothetical protein
MISRLTASTAALMLMRKAKKGIRRASTSWVNNKVATPMNIVSNTKREIA